MNFKILINTVAKVRPCNQCNHGLVKEVLINLRLNQQVVPKKVDVDVNVGGNKNVSAKEVLIKMRLIQQIGRKKAAMQAVSGHSGEAWP